MKARAVILLLASFLTVSAAPQKGPTNVPRPANLGEVSPDLAKPEMTRDAKGLVTIRCATPGVMIRYTIDGTDPVPKSGPYLAPIPWAFGGIIKARAFSADRKLKSEMYEGIFEALPGHERPAATLVPVTQDRDWPVYDWAERHSAVSVIVSSRKASLVFIGDSITQMFGGEPHDRRQPGSAVWDKHYEKRNVANLGFGYDYLENTLWRLQHGELDGAAAKVVVIHIGTNNAGRNTVEEIVTGIRAICSEVRRRQPQAKILLMGILPRGEKPNATRTKLEEVNKQLAQLDGDDNITYLDIGAKFVGADGTISREVMYDFLHPDAKGYQIWADAMEPVLSKLLGERK